MTPTATIITRISRLVAVGNRPARSQTRPVSWWQYQRAVELLSLFPAYVFMMAVQDAMRAPLMRGDVLTSKQLEELSNQFGRMAHQKAREEEAARK